MAGLLNGPFGKIAEAALETVCSNLPLEKIDLSALKSILTDGYNNTPNISEEKKIKASYEVFGSNIEGFCKMLKPAMELKKVLTESKSADRAKLRPASNSSSFNYYTPQKQSNGCRCNEDDSKKRNYKQKFSAEKNISWKKCDACKAFAKFLIPITCGHGICQNCLSNGKDCQKCLFPMENIKKPSTEKLHRRLFDPE